MNITSLNGNLISQHKITKEDIKNVLNYKLPWQELDGKTILVTGASGFLPAAMVEVLLALADQPNGPKIRIIALVRSRHNAEERFAAWLEHPALKLLIHDISKPLTFDGPLDVIIHAASQASPRYYVSDPVGTALPNVLGTYYLLELARIKKTSRFLYFSSGEIYGVLPKDQKYSAETDFGYLDPATLRACYGESKRMGETLCVSYAYQYGIPCVIVRPFHTYGPGMRLDDGRVFADFVKDVVMGQNLTLTSEGMAERAFCYLADATAGFFTALFKGKSGTAYNVGNAAAVISIKNLAELIVSLYPERRLVVIRSAQTDAKSDSFVHTIPRNAPATQRLQELGWIATTGLEAGFTRTIEVYLDAIGKR